MECLAKKGKWRMSAQRPILFQMEREKVNMVTLHCRVGSIWRVGWTLELGWKCATKEIAASKVSTYTETACGYEHWLRDITGRGKFYSLKNQLLFKYEGEFAFNNLEMELLNFAIEPRMKIHTVWHQPWQQQNLRLPEVT
jgi:hypothetical protein